MSSPLPISTPLQGIANAVQVAENAVNTLNQNRQGVEDDRVSLQPLFQGPAADIFNGALLDLEQLFQDVGKDAENLHSLLQQSYTQYQQTHQNTQDQAQQARVTMSRGLPL